jgi:hypothetical protein
MLKDEALVPDALHRLQNRYKWGLPTCANTPISTSDKVHNDHDQY